MKKLITLGSLLALSGVAFAAFTPTEDAAPQAPAIEAAQQLAENAAKPAEAEKVALAPEQAKMKDKDDAVKGEKAPRKHDGKMALPAGHPPVVKKMPAGHPQGFIDPASFAKDVKTALAAQDRTRVSLEGSITKQVNDNEYNFVDSTGTIKLEIHAGAWRGQMITPQDKVRVDGVLDKQWEQPEIKVKSLYKLN